METETIKQENELGYCFNPSSLSSSEVEYTFTFDCFLNDFSSDQIAQSKDNAKAKYSISFESSLHSASSEKKIKCSYIKPASSSSLEMPLVILFPRSKAPFSVNLLLEARDSINALCSSFDLENLISNAFALIASSVTFDQSTSGNSIIFFSNSMDNGNGAILLDKVPFAYLKLLPGIKEVLC